MIDCKNCVNRGSNQCPLLKGESVENIIKYQCPIYEKFEEKNPTPLEALKNIRELSEECKNFTLTNFIKSNCDIVEQALKRLEELERKDLYFENFHNTSWNNKIPLSTIINGLSQEEKYKFFEDCYYRYGHIMEKFATELKRNETLQLENKALHQVIAYQKEVLNALQDNFNLWKSRTGSSMLEILQHTTMTPTETKAVIEFFGGVKE